MSAPQGTRIAYPIVLVGGALFVLVLAAALATSPGDTESLVAPSPASTPGPTPSPTPTAGSTSSPDGAAAQGAEATAVVPDVGAVTEDVLARLPVRPEAPRAGYDRGLFPHWVDADRDGCDTRREVLIEESEIPATTSGNCSVAGRWFSAYDGARTTDASGFDIDHMVPLAEAWDSGAHGWTRARRQAFANDLGFAGSLMAVSASSNRSKSDKDPADWMPPREAFRCGYATAWVQVKDRWGLAVDQAELAALRVALTGCPGFGRAPAADTSTPSPTQAPAPGAVSFATMRCDAPGSPDDASNTNEEWVEVRNTGSSGVDLSGWSVSDEANHTYTFAGGFTLGPGATVKLRTGHGADSSTDVYWGRNQHVWNNTGDTAFLRDASGTLRAQKSC